MRAVMVPARRLDAAKSRLAPLLSVPERAAVALAMARDVVAACLAQSDWETWVVSSDPTVLRVADRAGARPLPEEGTTLLGAVGQAERAATGGDADALAVVLADLPWITPAALASALEPQDPVVGVRAGSDGGTNALIRRPPTVVPALFGRASYARHERAAAQIGLRVRRVETEELAFDLDRAEDVRRLLQDGRGGTTLEVCLDMGLAERLAARPAPHRSQEGEMQGTIKEFDPESGIGSLLLDDGTEVAIDPASTEGSEIRSLRLGQRVDFDVDEEGERKIARGLHIVTFA
jgi:2-phospho-L-lactate guanylyltransferase